MHSVIEKIGAYIVTIFEGVHVYLWCMDMGYRTKARSIKDEERNEEIENFYEAMILPCLQKLLNVPMNVKYLQRYLNMCMILVNVRMQWTWCLPEMIDVYIFILYFPQLLGLSCITLLIIMPFIHMCQTIAHLILARLEV